MCVVVICDDNIFVFDTTPLWWGGFSITRGYVFQPIPEKKYENKNIVVYLAMETYVKASLNDLEEFLLPN